MTYQEILANARTCIGPYCKACPQCNGKACGAQMPGPGAKGVGDTAIRNYDAWKKIRINLDTISENVVPDTSMDFFGHTMKYPFFAGPVGAVKLHYGDKLDDVAYNDINTGINYPSAMDALAAASNIVEHSATNGSEFVESVTFTPIGATTPITLINDDDNYLYWVYCVYDANGNRIDLSYNVGSEVYNIGAGCTVVWYYGSWTDFPDTLPNVTSQS